MKLRKYYNEKQQQVNIKRLSFAGTSLGAVKEVSLL